MGLGIFDEKNPLSLKMIGMHGSFAANKAVQNCDLLLNFGSRFDDRIIGDPNKFAPKAKIIHVDILYKNINRTIKTEYYINDDCQNVLHDMTYDKRFPYLFSGKLFDDWHQEINVWKKNVFNYPTIPNILQGRHVISSLNIIIQKDKFNSFTIVADVGAHQMWAAQFIDYNYPKIKFITSGGLGSMGFALPASIGVKIGSPYDKVICICGDGGFTMTMNELLTAIENKINIKVLIINNSFQLMVKMWQEKFYNGNIIGTKMNNPDFEKVCESFGCKSLKITHNDDLEKRLEYILNYEEGPIVANIITSENEPVLPMVCPGKALDEMIIDENNNEKILGDAPC
jgi:acetolactate synthase-1/2/3 large subunit